MTQTTGSTPAVHVQKYSPKTREQLVAEAKSHITGHVQSIRTSATQRPKPKNPDRVPCPSCGKKVHLSQSSGPNLVGRCSNHATTLQVYWSPKTRKTGVVNLG